MNDKTSCLTKFPWHNLAMKDDITKTASSRPSHTAFLYSFTILASFKSVSMHDFNFWLNLCCTGWVQIDIPYSTKCSWVFNFMNFTNLSPFTKIFWLKFLMHNTHFSHSDCRSVCVQQICVIISTNFFKLVIHEILSLVNLALYDIRWIWNYTIIIIYATPTHAQNSPYLATLTLGLDSFF